MHDASNTVNVSVDLFPVAFHMNLHNFPQLFNFLYTIQSDLFLNDEFSFRFSVNNIHHLRPCHSHKSILLICCVWHFGESEFYSYIGTHTQPTTAQHTLFGHIESRKLRRKHLTAFDTSMRHSNFCSIVGIFNQDKHSYDWIQVWVSVYMKITMQGTQLTVVR